MTRLSLALAPVLLLALAGPAVASGTPMDEARWLAWNASHIVVADAAGKVLEVWKGDLKPGDVLPVDKEAWKVPTPQVVRHGGAVGREVEGRKVTADRVIVFAWKATREKPDGKEPGEWVGLRPLFVSAGADGVYAQVYAPENGVQPVYAVAASEAAFRKEYMAIADVRTGLDAARAEPDAGRRAEKLRPFTAGEWRGIPEAVDALAGCGAAGVPVLADMLFKPDPKANPLAAEGTRTRALRALVKVGKPAAPALVKYLELQRAYWTLTGPDLGPDWYGQPANDQTASAQLRMLLAALADPAAYADVPADKRAAVRDLHDLWTKTPALAGTKTAGGLHPAKLTRSILEAWDKK